MNIIALLMLLAPHFTFATKDILDSFTICLRTLFPNFPEREQLVILESRECLNTLLVRNECTEWGNEM